MPKACFQHEVAARPFLSGSPGRVRVKRLNLRRLIHARHDGPLRRVKVKPHHIGDIFLKHRIVLIPEPMRRVRFQPCFRPFGGKSIPQIDF